MDFVPNSKLTGKYNYLGKKCDYCGEVKNKVPDGNNLEDDYESNDESKNRYVKKYLKYKIKYLTLKKLNINKF